MENRFKGNLNLQFRTGSVFRSGNSCLLHVFFFVVLFFPWPVLLDLEAYFS